MTATLRLPTMKLPLMRSATGQFIPSSKKKPAFSSSYPAHHEDSVQELMNDLHRLFLMEMNVHMCDPREMWKNDDDDDPWLPFPHRKPHRRADDCLKAFLFSLEEPLFWGLCALGLLWACFFAYALIGPIFCSCPNHVSPYATIPFYILVPYLPVVAISLFFEWKVLHCGALHYIVRLTGPCKIAGQSCRFQVWLLFAFCVSAIGHADVVTNTLFMCKIMATEMCLNHEALPPAQNVAAIWKFIMRRIPLLHRMEDVPFCNLVAIAWLLMLSQPLAFLFCGRNQLRAVCSRASIVDTEETLDRFLTARHHCDPTDSAMIGDIRGDVRDSLTRATSGDSSDSTRIDARATASADRDSSGRYNVVFSQLSSIQSADVGPTATGGIGNHVSASSALQSWAPARFVDGSRTMPTPEKFLNAKQTMLMYYIMLDACRMGASSINDLCLTQVEAQCKPLALRRLKVLVIRFVCMRVLEFTLQSLLQSIVFALAKSASSGSVESFTLVSLSLTFAQGGRTLYLEMAKFRVLMSSLASRSDARDMESDARELHDKLQSVEEECDHHAIEAKKDFEPVSPSDRGLRIKRLANLQSTLLTKARWWARIFKVFVAIYISAFSLSILNVVMPFVCNDDVWAFTGCVNKDLLEYPSRPS